MIKWIATAFALIASSTAAHATGEVYCRSVDGSDVAFGYGFGRVPGLAMTSAMIRVGGDSWLMPETENSIPIVLAQGAHDGARTIIDFTDPGFNDILASVRMIWAVEGDDHRSVGLLQIKDVGVFALVCE